MQQARWTHACGVFEIGDNEAVIVAGGRITSGPGDELASVEVMIVGQPYWQTRQPLPQPRLAPSMVIVDNIPKLLGTMENLVMAINTAKVTLQLNKYIEEINFVDG